MSDKDLIYNKEDISLIGPKILVIGVGGGGNNAINRMIVDDVQGAQFIAINTDAQALNNSQADQKVVIGYQTTKGLGAGANPDIGKKAAEESEHDLKKIIEGADMVFVAAGMGGGTGTGAAPVIASYAKKAGALTIGIVTKPFKFEGPKREKQAVEGIKEITKYVDSLIVVPNNRLLELIGVASLKKSFQEADNILKRCVQTVTGLITNNKALINLDFADIKNVMANKGNVLFGIGVGDGDKKAIEAANRAVVSPLLETEISGAVDAIINITGGETMTLNEANDAVDIVRQATNNSDVNIIFGVEINDHIEDQMIVSIIATGFDRGRNVGRTGAEEIARETSSIPWDRIDAEGESDTAKHPYIHPNSTSASDLMNEYKDKLANEKHQKNKGSQLNFQTNKSVEESDIDDDLPPFIAVNH